MYVDEIESIGYILLWKWKKSGLFPLLLVIAKGISNILAQASKNAFANNIKRNNVIVKKDITAENNRSLTNFNTNVSRCLLLRNSKVSIINT